MTPARTKFAKRWILTAICFAVATIVLANLPASSAEVFVVTTTADTADATPGDGDCADVNGECSLRAAISEANVLGDRDDINFAIPQTDAQFDPALGSFTIRPESELPRLIAPVRINGYSQPESSQSSLQPAIVLNGDLLGRGVPGLVVAGGDSRISGLAVGRFEFGIAISGGDGNELFGNWIGVNPGSPTGPVFGNTTGVIITSNNNTIGRPGGGNIIGRNASQGVELAGAENNRLIGNHIGVLPTGEPLANGANGVLLSAGTAGTSIGTTDPADGNVIANNRGPGIGLATSAGTNNSFIGNSMGGNGMEIDLGVDGPTPNDSGDVDTGPNDGQNGFEVEVAQFERDVTRALALIDGPPGRLHIEFWDIVAPSDTGRGGAGTRVGTEIVDHPGGQVVHEFKLNRASELSGLVTRCLDQACSQGATSEFAPNEAVRPNEPPKIEQVANQLNVVGDAAQVMLSFADDVDDDLTVSVVGLPPGLVFDPSTRLISGLVASTGVAAIDNHAVVVTVADAFGARSEMTFLWQVSDPSLVGTIPPTTTSSIPVIAPTTIPQTTTTQTTTPQTTIPQTTTPVPTTTVPATTSTPPTTTTTITTTTAPLPPAPVAVTTTNAPPPAATTTTQPVDLTVVPEPENIEDDEDDQEDDDDDDPEVEVVEDDGSPTDDVQPLPGAPTGPPPNAGFVDASPIEPPPPPPQVLTETESQQLVESAEELFTPASTEEAAVDTSTALAEEIEIPDFELVAIGSALVDLGQEATVPAWPLWVLAVATGLSTLAAAFLTSRSRLYEVVEDESLRTENGQFVMRSGAGPYWGVRRWRDASAVDLATLFGSGRARSFRLREIPRASELEDQ